MTLYVHIPLLPVFDRVKHSYAHKYTPPGLAKVQKVCALVIHLGSWVPFKRTYAAHSVYFPAFGTGEGHLMSVVKIIQFGGMWCKRMQALGELCVAFVELLGHVVLSAPVPDVLAITGLSATALKITSTAAELEWSLF